MYIELGINLSYAHSCRRCFTKISSENPFGRLKRKRTFIVGGCSKEA